MILGGGVFVEEVHERARMTEEQLLGRGIQDPRVLAAMASVPRHLFVDETLQDKAYGDFPLSIGAGQTISQPYMVARMTEALELHGHERVLEVGTGSGYQTAILAELAGQVYSIERFPELSSRAHTILTFLGYTNISVRVGDGTLGWKEEAPFDAILVTAASPTIPPPLMAQLADKGRLIIPLGRFFSQTLTRVVKEGESLSRTALTECLFVKLVGEYGWPES